MSVTSAREYKAKRYKTVSLPSGSVFKIRKIPPKTLGKLFSLLNMRLDQTEQFQESFMDNLPTIIDILFPACITEPRVEVRSSDPDVLTVDDIDPNDAFFLINTIFEFSGLTEEAMRQRRTFREEPNRADDSSAVANAK